MTCKIRENDDGSFVVITSAGNIARVTNGEAFVTRDRALAEEAVAYLSQEVAPMGKAQGSHRMKSMFGVFV